MRLTYPTLVLTLALAAAPAVAPAGDTPRPPGARAYFIAPADGATVRSPVTVLFGLAGMGVAPAGTEVENTGHHHLLLNRAPFDPATETAAPIPEDANHRHFGKGQTEVTLDLAPGTHTLQLLLGDWKHEPHAPPVASERITITVVP